MRGGEGVVTTAFVLRRDDRGHDEKRLAIIIWTRYGWFDGFSSLSSR